jgi:hypothetical protein
VFARRHWIPPGALIFAQLAHGVSWVLLAITALYTGVSALSGFSLAWIHTVAIGWITMAALAILIHVVPGFTDVQWRNERIVRLSLAPFAGGVVLFVAGWLLTLHLVVAGAVTMLAAFLCYFLITIATLRRARDVGKTEGAIARALSINLTFFLFVALIGVAMSGSLAYGWFAALLSRLQAIHANFAFYGWLTMLVYGVSARTMRPITGARSRFFWMHIVTGSSVLFGPLLFALGTAIAMPTVTWCGVVILGAGALFYTIDILDIVRRASVPHRPPQAFVVASILWLIVSTVLGFGLMLGKPWAGAYVFAVLVGWIGQMVNAHFLHIGVRLISTVVRGDEDETQPGELLDARLSWLAFVGMQTAVILCLCGLVFQIATFVAAGAAVGLAAWFTLLANAAVVSTKANELPISLAAYRR